MTPTEFDEALAELGWNGAEFTRRVGLVPNTVWRWRRGTTPIPAWVSEYLAALIGISRLHVALIAPRARPEEGEAEGT
jgi:hypothetical protein